MNDILEKLNPPQREAVTTIVGPVLIIAGAGSGKTRALTHRVAYLIREKNVGPRNILAVTFTNKAATEMKERIASLLSTQKTSSANLNKFHSSRSGMPTVGTFHSICVKILRSEIEKIGYKSSFNIFDDQDQLALMKKTMKELEINIDQFKPKSILGAISKAKNELIDTKVFATQISGYWEEMVSKVYSAYQKKLKEQEALDFDDILMLTVKVFKTYPETLEKYQKFFHYIMVDEYQDTNHAQYTLIKLLSQKHKNLCVVGDDWQGIYSWRGANIQNLLDFEKDYPEARIIKLEQNYRSTQAILDAAYGVISKNQNRKDKKIWTQNQGGHLLSSFEAQNEREEANFITNEITRLKKIRNFNLSDFVVLYRTNAQSRIIEEAMMRAGIPYRIIGGVKFYQRKEIKDVIAYLRLVNNLNDEISLERIVNFPKRGLGEASLKKWIALAKKNNLTLIEAGLNLDETSKLNSGKIDAIKKFSLFIKSAVSKLPKKNLADFVEYISLASGLQKALLDGTEEGEIRYENVRELLTVAKKYDEYEGEEALRLFLEEIALIADTDNIDQKNEAVHLMTLHSAKGLEFKIVFIAGLEEGILPHSRSMLNPNEMEEERRLMYVGITRAMERVYLLFTGERNIFGSTQINAPSRFLDDIPEHLIENCAPKDTVFTDRMFGKNSPDSKPIICNATFKDGNRVKHEIFGEGMIVATQGDIITVAFKEAGLKKLSAAIAPLKKVID